MNSIRYGETTIPYLLVRRPKKTLSITVHPDRSVIVRAPADADIEIIQTRVLRRARWIIRQQEDLAHFVPRAPSRQYIGGETHRYLGRQYLLKVVTNGAALVRLARPRLEVHVPGQPSAAATRRLLLQWYRKRADAVFAERWPRCQANVERYGVSATPFQLLNMKRRWGSCTPTRRVLLNPELVKAPSECIDYVMLHELCHLRYPAHDWRFYRFLSQVCPNWPRLQSRLNAVEL